MTFEKLGFQVVRKVISSDLTSHLVNEINLSKQISDFYSGGSTNKRLLNDGLVDKAYFGYGSIFGESLLRGLKNEVESVVNKKLDETYSYYRIYYNGSVLQKHKDRPSCEYSTTLNLQGDHPWPIYIKDLTGNVNELLLEPGDMCVYKGCEVQHWRDPYPGTEFKQIFLHYVDIDGKNKDFKYDTRPMVGLPDQYKNEILIETLMKKQTKKITYN